MDELSEKQRKVSHDIRNPISGITYLNIRVSDTGVGMSDEKIEEILQGEAESEGGTGGEKGYGFGLSLVHHLVQQAEGEIELESEEGKGTEFRITLPV